MLSSKVGLIFSSKSYVSLKIAKTHEVCDNLSVIGFRIFVSCGDTVNLVLMLSFINLVQILVYVVRL